MENICKTPPFLLCYSDDSLNEPESDVWSASFALNDKGVGKKGTCEKLSGSNPNNAYETFSL